MPLSPVDDVADVVEEEDVVDDEDAVVAPPPDPELVVFTELPQPTEKLETTPRRTNLVKRIASSFQPRTKPPA